jgi:hypothetical protein
MCETLCRDIDSHGCKPETKINTTSPNVTMPIRSTDQGPYPTRDGHQTSTGVESTQMKFSSLNQTIKPMLCLPSNVVVKTQGSSRTSDCMGLNRSVHGIDVHLV